MVKTRLVPGQAGSRKKYLRRRPYLEPVGRKPIRGLPSSYLSITSKSYNNYVFVSMEGQKLKQGILIFKREARTLKFVTMVQKAELVPFLLALMPEACATTKLDKEFWLDIFRPGLKKLHDVLNRVGKSDISVLNRVKT